jgi:hypothetical protein
MPPITTANAFVFYYSFFQNCENGLRKTENRGILWNFLKIHVDLHLTSTYSRTLFDKVESQTHTSPFFVTLFIPCRRQWGAS